MSEFIESANFPVKRVSTVLCGNIGKECETALKGLKISIIKADKSNLLGENVSGHIDLQCIHLGNNKILVSSEQKRLIEELAENGFDVTEFDGLGKNYPSDCLVNAAAVGRYVICKESIICSKLRDFIDENCLEIINTNQGYSKCSVCIVDENSVITEDQNIKNACEKYGIDVLLIRKGYVRLEGFEYGFIGGAAFRIDEKTLVFNGNITEHPDYSAIKQFLDSKGMNIISINEYPLTDIGGVIPLLQD